MYQHVATSQLVAQYNVNTSHRRQGSSSRHAPAQQQDEVGCHADDEKRLVRDVALGGNAQQQACLLYTMRAFIYLSVSYLVNSTYRDAETPCLKSSQRPRAHLAGLRVQAVGFAERRCKQDACKVCGWCGWRVHHPTAAVV